MSTTVRSVTIKHNAAMILCSNLPLNQTLHVNDCTFTLTIKHYTAMTLCSNLPSNQSLHVNDCTFTLTVKHYPAMSLCSNLPSNQTLHVKDCTFTLTIKHYTAKTLFKLTIKSNCTPVTINSYSPLTKQSAVCSKCPFTLSPSTKHCILTTIHSYSALCQSLLTNKAAQHLKHTRG